MANCEKCVKADVCKNYEPKSTIACKHYAEAVVKCKGCKYYRNHPNGLCYAHTEPYGTGYKGETICVEPDDFCSYGERKEVQE